MQFAALAYRSTLPNLYQNFRQTAENAQPTAFSGQAQRAAEHVAATTPAASDPRLEADSASFADQARAKFSAQGINVPPEVILTTDAEGRVRVSNAHPDKARIEQMFEANPMLRRQFSEISGRASLQRASQLQASTAANLPGQSAQSERLATTAQRPPFSMSVGVSSVQHLFGIRVSA